MPQGIKMSHGGSIVKWIEDVFGPSAIIVL